MKVLCFGDSNTYGYDPRSFWGDRYDSNCRWVDILAEKLGCTVINAGENGREIPNREYVYHHFDLMMNNFGAIDLLIVMLGSNDLLQGNSAGTVAERMESFLRRIKLDKLKILLIAPPPMQLGQWVNTKTMIDASIELKCKYQKIAEHMGIRFMDAGQWNIAQAYDGVHFTEEGHKAFAEGLYHKLTEGE